MKCFYCNEITNGEYQMIKHHRNEKKTIFYFCNKHQDHMLNKEKVILQYNTLINLIGYRMCVNCGVSSKNESIFIDPLVGEMNACDDCRVDSIVQNED
jgi:hypothetical protein